MKTFSKWMTEVRQFDLSGPSVAAGRVIEVVKQFDGRLSSVQWQQVEALIQQLSQEKPAAPQPKSPYDPIETPYGEKSPLD